MSVFEFRQWFESAIPFWLVGLILVSLLGVTCARAICCAWRNARKGS